MQELKKLSKRQLILMILELQQQIAELKAEVARLRKDSSNSSKPPSSDIVKPPRPTPQDQTLARRIGAQLGHPKHQRQPFPSHQIDQTELYTLLRCPDCGGPVRRSPQPARVIQQAELVEKPIQITEHRALAYWCPRCGKVHHAPLPPQVQKGGLVGPRLTAFCAYLKGAAHVSYSGVQQILQDVIGLPLCRGQMVKLIGKTSRALEGGYQQLQARLPCEPKLNVDETGHPEKGQGLWTWCFRAERFTWFKIDPSRGSQVLLEVLGAEFNGVLGCDYFSAYRKYMKDFGVEVQFCLAHLIREVKFLTTLADPRTRAYGQRLLDKLRDLFGIIHRRDSMSASGFQRALEGARQAVIATGQRAPCRSEAQNLAQRFRQHGAAYFRFITTPGVAPTNNLAEQAIRFVVIDRRLTQGTRGPAGRRWCERIWTVIATCAQQGRSVFEYLHTAILANFRGLPAPSLLDSS